MPKLDPKKLAKNFRDRNRRFLALGVQKQRLKIVKDVLSLLEEKKIVAKSNNTYLNVHSNPESQKNWDLDNQVHTVLEQNRCTVCGIGSVFVSAVMLNNKLEVKNLRRGDPDDIEKREIVGYLKKWFDSEQLDLIEIAFEATSAHSRGVQEGNFHYENQKSAFKFGRRYRSDKTRLKAICKNILANKGKFVP
jgi:hypothetical protein